MRDELELQGKLILEQRNMLKLLAAQSFDKHDDALQIFPLRTLEDILEYPPKDPGMKLFTTR